jgi:hypothetical protein
MTDYQKNIERILNDEPLPNEIIIKLEEFKKFIKKTRYGVHNKNNYDSSNRKKKAIESGSKYAERHKEEWSQLNTNENNRRRIR